MLPSEFAIRRSVSQLCLLGLLLLSGAGAHATIYYVRTTGNDANNGLSWATAKKTVQAANSLTTPSDQIWVGQGTYTLASTINLNSGVALYGGFNGTENSLSQRNYTQNVTILDGDLTYIQVVTPYGASVNTRVDGFTFQHGDVYDCVAYGSVTLANNTFNEAGNDLIGSCILLQPRQYAADVVVNNQVTGNGLYAQDDATCSVTLTGNTVGGSGSGNGGIWLGVLSAVVNSNTVQDNDGVGMRVGVYGAGLVSDNIITSNDGGGLACYGFLVIKDNLIANNSTGSVGGGLYLGGGSGWTVANNTIVDNAAGGATDGGGIYIAGMSSSSTYNIANNIVAFNSSGIDTDGSSAAGLTLTTNDVFGSDYNNGLPPGPTDISLDPMFFDHIDRNYHLATKSPCIDAGTDSFVAPGDTDLDGNPRIYGAHVDIGCYEWTPSPYPDLASLTLSATTLCSGQSAMGLVTLTGNALPAGAVVQLTSSSPGALTVPASVTVPGGSNSASFTMTADAITAPQTAVVSATYRGITQSVTVTVNPLIASFTLSHTVVIGGAGVTGKIVLNCPAPAAFTINLYSSDPSVKVPVTAVVLAGATSKTFTATTKAVSAVKTVTLTATDGAQTLTAMLTVDPSATIKNLVITPAAITGGLTAIGVVTLTAPAPAGGIVIPIANSKPSAASAPALVTIAAKERSVSFPITTSVVSASTPVTLTAALGAVTKAATLTVSPATIAALTLVPSTVQGGSENSIGIVTLAMPATSPVPVTLLGGPAGTPDVTSILIPTGALQGTFNISTATVTVSTPVTIQATVYGLTKKATLTVTP